jgi:prepilin-type N-terminal cleavage/methylation domain-containing protein
MIYHFKNKKAFTLVEVLVSIAILSVIILGINRVYFTILNNQKSIMSENFVHADIEYFFRIAINNIRSAEMSDGASCSIDSGKFFFVSPELDLIRFIKNGECFEFYLSDDDFRGVGFFEEGTFVDQVITSSETEVLDLFFIVEDNISTGQPLATILIKAAPRSSLENHIYAQTSVSLNY